MNSVNSKAYNTQFYSIIGKVQQYATSLTPLFLKLEDDNFKDKDGIRDTIFRNIEHYLDSNNLRIEGLTTSQLRHRIWLEMKKYSFLSLYLEDPSVEEININKWNDIKVHYDDGRIVACPEQFNSPDHARDILVRMLHDSRMVWDSSNPTLVGNLPGNIRITVLGWGVIDEGIGAVASIRKVNGRQLTKANFVKMGTATDEMLNFLITCYTHGISICVTGATNSGKTTLVNTIVADVPNDKRLVTIEQGTREFHCQKIDPATGAILNNAIHLQTKITDDPSKNVTQSKLLELAMTMNPDCIVVGESKGEEAMQAVNAANTGHGVITTTHANSCAETYDRFLSLCKQAFPTMDDKMLMSLIVKAFRVVVFIKKMPDNSRKILDIVESYKSPDGQITSNSLYHYAIHGYKMLDGKRVPDGEFIKTGCPSDELRYRLIENGLSESDIQDYFREA